MKNRTLVGIIGTGLVGSDLLAKVQRSAYLDCSIFTGIREDSPGIAKAKKMGIKTSTKSIGAIVKNFQSQSFYHHYCQIVFDCTSAKAHIKHAPILKSMGKFVIDLTPSRVGKMCVPSINLEECLKEDNVNMATCGGQAMTPIAKKIMEYYPEIEYMEIVSAIASSSAGIGTRENIDEYTQTTSDVLEELAGVPKAKAIIILNPAVPSIDMRNTLLYKIDGELQSRTRIIKTTDGLPGNLNIINKAALKVAEEYARRKDAI